MTSGSSHLSMLSARKCPCCWPCNGIFLENLPFVVDTGGFLRIDGTYDTSNGNTPPGWVTPTKAAIYRDVTGSDGIYATGVFDIDAETGEDQDCQWIAIQYCVPNEAGTNGRAWMIEFHVRDTITGDVGVFVDEVLDWTCTCDGALWQYEVDFDTDAFPCLLPPPDVTLCADGCPECYTLVASGFGGGSDGVNANGTFVLRRDPCSSPNCGGNTSWNVTYGAYNWTLIASSSVPSGSARLWFLQWGSSASSDCRGPNAVWYRGDVFGVIDCSADVSLVGARTGTGLPRMTSWPTSLTLTPGGC